MPRRALLVTVLTASALGGAPGASAQSSSSPTEYEVWNKALRAAAADPYTWSHKLEDLADGSVKATLRVRQQNVPDDFQMIVPVLLEFGEEFATVLVEVGGPVTEVELPLLPRRPKSLVFNPYESVLAETRTEGWR
jgi:hypothetical protein